MSFESSFGEINSTELQWHIKLPPKCETAFAGDFAILLMDDCSTHISDDVIRPFPDARMRVITCAPHTTQIFQVLYLALFGVLKRRPRYELPFDGENATVKVITKVSHDIRQTML
jgi:hypothetical protein